MNTKVASSPRCLKRRIEHFFEASHQHQAARELLTALAARQRVWIFGGMIRDIGLYGSKGFSSDIDVVVEGSLQSLAGVFADFSIVAEEQNKFGGLRFRYRNFDFDVWSLSDTWAFKQQHIHCFDETSLLNTTLMTWDSVLYDVIEKKIISRDDYLEDLYRRRLELVLHETPNLPGSMIKILRTIYNKQVAVFGPNLREFLLRNLEYYDFEMLKTYEYDHYQAQSFTKIQLQFLLNTLQTASEKGDMRFKCKNHCSL
jgi:predicted nucleotidyltransferase